VFDITGVVEVYYAGKFPNSLYYVGKFQTPFYYASKLKKKFYCGSNWLLFYFKNLELSDFADLKCELMQLMEEV
jgi:hypothetical protein